MVMREKEGQTFLTKKKKTKEKKTEGKWLYH